jgi:DNA-binding beta-propeller fold protein YncE
MNLFNAMKIHSYAWLACLLLCGCTWDKVSDQAHGYPEDIAEVLRVQCATSGCHNTQSAAGAAGLNLSTWESLFQGSRGGSAVVPYSPEQSYLLYSVNTDTGRGPTLSPTMPLGGATLTDAQYERLRLWIADGARNIQGLERFPPNATRRKWYVANQGCDLVAVLDADSRQIMRYVQVGQSASTEQPHSVKVSKDGRFWYAIFLSLNPRIEKYSTLTDEKVGEITIGNGSWNTFSLSSDGNYGVAVSYVSGGSSAISVVIVDLVNDVVTESLNFPEAVHGSCAHPTLSRFYITMQDVSGLWQIDYDSDGHVDNVEPIDLMQGTLPLNGVQALKPHELIFTPDGSKYFVSCQFAREVRAYDAVTNDLLAVIQVGDDPVEMAISPTTGHLFVTCMEDVTSFPSEPTRHGSVAVIDYGTNAFVKAIYTGHQPHGLVVDPVSGYLVVANRNVSSTGPAPHHTNNCGGRNGYLTAIDLQTLELVDGFKPEMSSDPYAITLKP